MKRRFILYRRKLGGTFYVEDTETRKQESLGTKDHAEAMSLLNARNESVRQPQLNLHIASFFALPASMTKPSRWAMAGSFSASSTRLSSRARKTGNNGTIVSAARSIPPMLVAYRIRSNA